MESNALDHARWQLPGSFSTLREVPQCRSFSRGKGKLAAVRIEGKAGVVGPVPRMGTEQAVKVACLKVPDCEPPVMGESGKKPTIGRKTNMGDRRGQPAQ